MKRAETGSRALADYGKGAPVRLVHACRIRAELRLRIGRPRSGGAGWLEVYAKRMKRDRDTGTRMDALVDWARMGTNGTEEAVVVASLGVEEEREPAL